MDVKQYSVVVADRIPHRNYAAQRQICAAPEELLAHASLTPVRSGTCSPASQRILDPINMRTRFAIPSSSVGSWLTSSSLCPVARLLDPVEHGSETLS